MLQYTFIVISSSMEKCAVPVWSQALGFSIVAYTSSLFLIKAHAIHVIVGPFSRARQVVVKQRGKTRVGSLSNHCTPARMKLSTLAFRLANAPRAPTSKWLPRPHVAVMRRCLRFGEAEGCTGGPCSSAIVAKRTAFRSCGYGCNRTVEHVARIGRKWNKVDNTKLLIHLNKRVRREGP